MATALVSGDSVLIGEALYRPRERAILRDGAEQRLEPKQAGVLELLTDRAGETVTRDELLDTVWGDEGSDEALTQAISRLRQTLGNRDLIRTEPKQGYRLTVVPTLAPAIGEPAEDVAAVSMPPARFDARSLKLAFGLGMIAGLTLALVAALILWPRPVTITEEISQPVDGPPVTTRRECEGSFEECAAQNRR